MRDDLVSEELVKIARLIESADKIKLTESFGKSVAEIRKIKKNFKDEFMAEVKKVKTAEKSLQKKSDAYRKETKNVIRNAKADVKSKEAELKLAQRAFKKAEKERSNGSSDLYGEWIDIHRKFQKFSRKSHIAEQKAVGFDNIEPRFENNWRSQYDRIEFAR